VKVGGVEGRVEGVGVKGGEVGGGVVEVAKINKLKIKSFFVSTGTLLW
jgi:hypothetical protein